MKLLCDLRASGVFSRSLSSSFRAISPPKKEDLLIPRSCVASWISGSSIEHFRGSFFAFNHQSKENITGIQFSKLLGDVAENTGRLKINESKGIVGA
ncbi:hypothetical protein VNO77_22696 [Canavalia gladiata]|uniref:Uncharacterized protein n=1 Tax=Canavalia gladiata TaxID=3824 RepID=A0AAN9L6I4_CANGL